MNSKGGAHSVRHGARQQAIAEPIAAVHRAKGVGLGADG